MGPNEDAPTEVQVVDKYSEPSLPSHVPVKADAVSVHLFRADSAASPSSPSTSVPCASVELPPVKTLSSIQLETGFIEAAKLPESGDGFIEAEKLPGSGDGFIEADKIPGSECMASCNGHQKPLFSLWPGRNRFFCDGYCITGGENDVPCCPSPSAPNMCAWFCILLPSSIYFIFVFKEIFDDVHPALPILTTIFFLLTVCSLLGTCMTDPGVIPRRDVILATKEREKLIDCLGFDVLGATGNGQLKTLSQPQIEALIPEDLLEKGYRWCSTCKIIRPPRSSHCSYCDNCVMRFDHHCPFVNNCVGQRNYHVFFTFVSSVACLSMFMLPSIGWWLIRRAGGTKDKPSITWIQYPLYIMLGIVCLAACLLLGIWGYHTFLLYTGQTTREHLAGKKVKNLDREASLCAKRGPKLYNPRAVVVEGDFLKKKRPLWGSNRRTFGNEYYCDSTKRKDSTDNSGSTGTHDVENPEGPTCASDTPPVSDFPRSLT